MTERTYEMLWDCHYCGTKKLLGLTHRHCPECGAAQDPSLRYFPADADKVAVEDHVYHGADVLCPACKAPSSAAAKCCGNCGSPFHGAGQARQRTDQVAVAGGGFTGETEADAKHEATGGGAAAPTKKSRKGLVAGIVIGVLVLIGVAAAVLLLWKQEVGLQAFGHTWKREVMIEAFQTLSQSAWCDSMPGDASAVTRSREVRSHRQIPDGQECRTRRKDRGDGTYSETQECKTKYRSEPVYDMKCQFKVNRWAYSRSAIAEGKSLAEQPAWPAVQLEQAGKKPDTLGNEREGARSETYTVRFVDAEQQQHSCELPQANWASIPAGSAWNGEVGVLTGALDCATLKPQGAR
ncbi:MAG TPA: zinc ribbon domain-containing protein [Polyangia bacterium]|nr:zinc ribbon domain-containing protein [Polyangia bacterium]